MKKLFMLVMSATLLSSSCVWAEGAQEPSWASRGYRGLSIALTGIPGAIALGYAFCDDWTQDETDKAMQPYVVAFGAVLLLETAYKSSWYFSNRDCEKCAAHNSNA